MTDTLPHPQTEQDYFGRQKTGNRYWEENGKVYEYEYTSRNLTAAKRMKTRTEKWAQKYVDNKVHRGYDIIIRPQYRQHELWHVVYCRWTDDDEEATTA
jgi:hypothetical protein